MGLGWEGVKDEKALYPRVLGGENLQAILHMFSERNEGKTRWCHQDKKTAQNIDDRHTLNMCE